MKRKFRSILAFAFALMFCPPTSAELPIADDTDLAPFQQEDSALGREVAISRLRFAIVRATMDESPGPASLLYDSLLRLDSMGQESLNSAWDFFYAADSFRKAMEISRRLLVLPDSEPLVGIRALGQMGQSHMNLGSADSALFYFRRMLERSDSLRRDAPQDSYRAEFHEAALQRVSWACKNLGDTVLAISHARAYQAAKEGRRSWHTGSPALSDALLLDGLGFHASTLAWAGKRSAADSLFRRIVQISQRWIGHKEASSDILSGFVDGSLALATLRLEHRPDSALEIVRNTWKMVQTEFRRSTSPRLEPEKERHLRFLAGVLEGIHGSPDMALRHFLAAEDSIPANSGVPDEMAYFLHTVRMETQGSQGNLGALLADSSHARVLASGSDPKRNHLASYHLLLAGTLRRAGDTLAAGAHSDSAQAKMARESPEESDEQDTHTALRDRIERACMAGIPPREALDSARARGVRLLKGDPTVSDRMKSIELEASYTFCRLAADPSGSIPPFPKEGVANLRPSEIGAWLEARGALVRLLVLSGRGAAAEQEALAALDTARRFQRLEAARWIQVNLAHARFLQGKTVKAEALYRVLALPAKGKPSAFDWKTIVQDDLPRMRRRFPALEWPKAILDR